ncbi:MAG: hypothetical protein RLZZ584_1111 [Pseudomonadota bacterium]
MPRPYTLHIADSVLVDLRECLARTRWPEQPPGEAWATGTDRSYLQRVVEHWRSGFDWRAQEAGLNQLRQYTVPLDGIELHCIHEPGQPRFGANEMADTFATLMTEVLGYPRFAAQGGDWGAFTTTRLGQAHADKVVGIHLNLLAVRRDPQLLQGTGEAERRFVDELPTSCARRPATRPSRAHDRRP